MASASASATASSTLSPAHGGAARLTTHAARLAALCLASTAAYAQHDPLPRAWTWSPATGPAASHPSLLPLVRLSLNATSNPTTVADSVCDLIIARGLGEGEVAITLLSYGRGTLMGNPLDAMQGTGLPDTLARGTPWSANGVTAVSTWTDAFIARYQARQASSGVPAPSRFHMDSELRLPTLCYLPNVEPCWGTAPLQMFDAMRADPRWSTEPLRMNPGLQPTLRTMDELYQSAGSPRYDPAFPRDAEVNRAWSAWWDGIMRESVDGALSATLYERVRTAWPGVASSEFAQSMRLDGATEPDGSTRGYTDFEWWNEGWMPASSWCGRADLQAPAFYVFGETFVDATQPFMDEQMRLHRANLDACLHSFDGVDPSEITPWVTLPTVALPFGEAPATNLSYTPEQFMRILALFRSRGIGEFMLWPGVSDSTWVTVADGIDAVWRPNLDSVESVGGTVSAEAVALLRRGDRQPCTVIPSKAGLDLRANFGTDAASPCDAEGSLWIAFEASTPAAAQWTISVGESRGEWRPVAVVNLPAASTSVQWIGPIDAEGIVSTAAPQATITVRMTSTSVETASIDLVQVVHWSHRRADVNRDGTVDSVDLAELLATWATDDPATDLNRDGVVSSADLARLLAAWGSACE